MATYYRHARACIFPPGVAPYVQRSTAWLAEPLGQAWWWAWHRIGVEYREKLLMNWWWRWAYRQEPLRVEILPATWSERDGEPHAAYCDAPRSRIIFDARVCRGLSLWRLQEAVAHELGHLAFVTKGADGGGDEAL